MAHQILIGSALILASVFVQLAFIGAASAAMSALGNWFLRPPKTLKTHVVLGLLALWLMAGLSTTVWLWAASFLSLGVFQDLETSLYFSVVVFTTLGFGDIVPPQPWRLLTGLSAANGLMIFGISTAFLVEALRRLWIAQHEAE